MYMVIIKIQNKAKQLQKISSQSFKTQSNTRHNATLSAMLNEFAGIRKVSDESLGRDETPRHISHEI